MLVDKRVLDKHWEEILKHKLGRQKYSLKKYFEFEINEAILSLDQKEPEIEMALSRLNHMREYLEKM